MTIRHTGIIRDMIMDMEKKSEIKKPLSANMKFAILSVFLSTTSYTLRRYSIQLPFEINSFEVANTIGFLSICSGGVKLLAGFATLPKEPEQYMLDDAKRFKIHGSRETLVSAISLLINFFPIWIEL